MIVDRRRRTAVVLVEFHSEGLVAERAAEALGLGYEVVVGDNSGTYTGPGLVIDTGGNVGFGAACNAAVAALDASVDVIVLQNPDATIAPSNLERLVSALRQGRWSALAPAIAADRVRPFGYAVPTMWRLAAVAVAEVLRARRIRGATVRRARAVAAPTVGGETPVERPGRFGTAALLALDRRTFEEVGGFDPRYFLYVEDLDLWLRLSRRGRVGFLPGVTAEHRQGTGSDAPVALRILLRWLGRELLVSGKPGRWPLLRSVHVIGLLLLPTPASALERHITSGLRRWRSPRRLQEEVRLMAGPGDEMRGQPDEPADRVGDPSNDEAERSGRPLRVYLIHYDAPDWLRSAAESVLASDISIALTVVNNGPQTDLGVPDDVRVISSGGNLGYAGGANVGLRELLASDDAYCVVGAHDLHVEPDTLRLLVETAEQRPEYGIVGPRLEGAKLGAFVLDEGVERVEWASGTCLLLRRSCIERVGLFDEEFHSYSEDQEIGLRATDAGLLVGRVPDARARGLGSSASESSVLTVATNLLLRHKRGGPVAVARGLVLNTVRALASLVLGFVARDAQRRQGHKRRLQYTIRGTLLGLLRISQAGAIGRGRVSRRIAASGHRHR